MGAEDELRSAIPMAKPSITPTSYAPNPTSSSSDKNTVLLRDWWLIKVDGDCGVKRLAVGGLMTRQQATRVFSSAPIKKRYDAYTLETVDGITVIIQGMINKARTSENGIPLEVCSRFLIGFPYNWDYYADEYLGKDPTLASASTCSYGGDEKFKDSADSPGHTLPVHLNEFPMGRVFDILTTTGEALRGNFTDTLKKLFSHSSVASSAQRSSGSLVKNCHNYETDRSSQRPENRGGSASFVVHDAEGHDAEKRGCSKNNFLEGDILEEDFPLNQNTSHDSSSPINHETGIQAETGAAMLNEAPLESIQEMEKNNLIVSPASQECDKVDNILDSLERKVDGETSKASMDMELENGLNDLFPEELNSSHLKSGNKPVNGAMTTHHSVEGLRVCEMDTLDNSANSLNVKMHLASESRIDSDVTKSSETSTRKKGVKARFKISLQKEIAVSSSFPVFQQGANLCLFKEKTRGHNELKLSNADFPGILKESPANEMISSERDPNSQIGSAVDINNAIVSKKGGRQKKNSQKENQKCAKGLDENESADKERSTGRIPSHTAEGPSSTNNVHHVSCLSRVRTRSQHKNSSAFIVCNSESMNETSTCLSKGESMKKLTNPEAETLSNWMSTCKNISSDDPTVKSSLDVEKKQIKSVLIDHNVANAVSVVKQKSSRKHDQGLAAVRAEKCTLQPSPKDFITACAFHLSSISTPIPTYETRKRVDEHARNHTYVSNDNDNGAFNCSGGHSAKTTNQSDMSAPLNSCQDKAFDVIEKKTRKKFSDQDANNCEVLRKEQPSRNKASHATGKKATRRPILYVHHTPFTRDKAKKFSMASPDSLNLKRSRSGRLIVPALDNGYQQIVYDADGSIAGIKGLDTWKSPSIGSKSEPVKKRKGFL